MMINIGRIFSMKINIGPYRSYLTSYNIVSRLIFWERTKDTQPLTERLHTRWSTVLDRFCEWYNSHRYTARRRRINIRIDGYDAWNADTTLAMIIAPTLKKLAECDHSFGLVDDEDVPETLRSTSAPTLTEDQKETGHVDDNAGARWRWVLQEMVWSFEYAAKRFEDDTAVFSPTVANDARADNGRRLFAKYFHSLWD